MLRSYDKHFIGGAWRPSTGTGVIEVVNPATEQVIGRVPAGTPEDADAAIKSARSAFPDWAQTGLRERTRYVELLCEALAGRAAELAEVIMAEVGTPRSLAEPVQVGLPITEARCLIASTRPHNCIRSGHLDSQRVPIAVDLVVVGIKPQPVLMTKLLGDQVKSLLQV